MKYIINSGDEDALNLVRKLEKNKNKSFISLTNKEMKILFSDRIIQLPEKK